MAPILRWRYTDRGAGRLLRYKRVVTRLIDRSGVYGAIEAIARTGRHIQVTRHRIAAPVERPIRIAHLTDLHVRRHGAREDLLNRLLDREAPDAIVMSGDFTGLGGPPDACATVLGRMRAPLGVWTTLGNWDYWSPVPDWPAFLDGLGIRLLRNDATEIVPGVWLVGLDSAVAASPDLELAMSRVPSGAFTLGLIHCPVLFDETAGRLAVSLAGHTHGGQIRVPGLPPLFMPKGCRPYADGWYGARGSLMYVNRGIGSPGYPVRVFCREEIAIMTLEPSGAAPGTLLETQGQVQQALVG